LPGIGRYTALALANYGVKQLALADVNLEAMHTTPDEIKKKHSDLEIKVLKLDVSKETLIEQAIDETVAQFGRIDFAVNNAGTAGPNKPTIDVEVGCQLDGRVVVPKGRDSADVETGGCSVRVRIKSCIPVLGSSPLIGCQVHGKIEELSSMWPRCWGCWQVRRKRLRRLILQQNMASWVLQRQYVQC
jgi:hypothetical protein